MPKQNLLPHLNVYFSQKMTEIAFNIARKFLNFLILLAVNGELEVPKHLN